MTFKDLLLRAKNRDSKAIEQLISMYESLIIRYSFFNNSFDEDLHQDQLLRFIYCVEKFSIVFPE